MGERIEKGKRYMRAIAEKEIQICDTPARTSRRTYFPVGWPQHPQQLLHQLTRFEQQQQGQGKFSLGMMTMLSSQQQLSSLQQRMQQQRLLERLTIKVVHDNVVMRAGLGTTAAFGRNVSLNGVLTNVQVRSF